MNSPLVGNLSSLSIKIVDDLSMNGACGHSTVFDDCRCFTIRKEVHLSISSSLEARSHEIQPVLSVDTCERLCIDDCG